MCLFTNETYAKYKNFFFFLIKFSKFAHPLNTTTRHRHVNYNTTYRLVINYNMFKAVTSVGRHIIRSVKRIRQYSTIYVCHTDSHFYVFVESHSKRQAKTFQINTRLNYNIYIFFFYKYLFSPNDFRLFILNKISLLHTRQYVLVSSQYRSAFGIILRFIVSLDKVIEN